MPTQELCSCRGVNGSIALYSNKMVVRHGGPASTHSHEIPLAQIRSILVERKSIIPFSTITVIAAAIAVLAKYNPVWFLVNLPDQESTLVSFGALSIAIVFAVPAVLRSMFVNVSVRSEGEPVLVRLGFVPVRPARRMAKQFRELSNGG